MAAGGFNMIRCVVALTVIFSQLLSLSTDSKIEDSLKTVFSNDFGYTLIGEKPISVEQSLNLYLCLNRDERDCLFKFMSLVFKNSETFVFKKLKKYGFMELINIKSLINQIMACKKLRKFIIKKHGSVYAFLEKLKDPEISVFDVLDHDPILLAIVFGYGEENGEFFVRRCLLGHYLQKYPLVKIYPFDGIPTVDKIRGAGNFVYDKLRVINKPRKPTRFLTLNDEWQWIKSVSREFNKSPYPEVPYYISLPGYVSRHGPESGRIHEKFLMARDKLANLFCGRNISEVIAEEAAKK